MHPRTREHWNIMSLDDQIEAFIRDRGVTLCPPAACAETTARVPPGLSAVRREGPTVGSYADLRDQAFRVMQQRRRMKRIMAKVAKREAVG